RMDDAAALSRVIDELQGMQRERGDSAQRVEARERFALFAALALILLALDMVLYGTAPLSARQRTVASERVSDAAREHAAASGQEAGTDGDAAARGGAARHGGTAPPGTRRRSVPAAMLALLFAATA